MHHLFIAYVSSKYYPCIQVSSTYHLWAIYALSMYHLCIIYVASLYHSCVYASSVIILKSLEPLEGVSGGFAKHLGDVWEASGAIWKHFEVPGTTEGDSGGFENYFCLRINMFLA